MASNPKVTINLAMNGVQTVLSGFSNISSAITGLAKKASLATAAITGIAGVGSFAGFIAGVKHAAELGSRISDVATRTGIAAKDVLILEQAFKNCGVSADAVPKAVGYLQKSLIRAKEQGGETAKAFQKLGLNVEDVLKMNPEQQFFSVQKALAGVGDAAQRTAIAMRIFEEGGSQFLPVILDPDAISRADRMLGGLSDTIGRNAKVFDSISDSFNALGIKRDQFFAGFLGQVDDIVMAFLNKFEAIDFTSLGEKFGALVQVFKKAWEDGNLVELIKLTFEAGIELGMEKLGELANWFSKNGEFFNLIWNGISYLVTKGFLYATTKVLEFVQTLETILYAAVIYAFSKAIDFLKVGIGTIPAVRFFLSDEAKKEMDTPYNLSFDVAMEQSKEDINPYMANRFKTLEDLSEGLDAAYGELLTGAFTKDGESALERLNKNLSETVRVTNGKKDDIASAAASVADAASDNISNIAENVKVGIENILQIARDEVSKTQREIESVKSNWTIIDSEKQRQTTSLLQEQRMECISLIRELDNAIDKYNELAQKARAAGNEKDATRYQNESDRMQSERTKTQNRMASIDQELAQPNINSVADQIHSQSISFVNEMGTVAQQIGKLWNNTAKTMQSSMADVFYNVATGATEARDIMSQLSLAIGQSMLRCVLDTISSFIMRNTVLLALNAAFNAAGIAQKASTDSTIVSMETAKNTAILESAIPPAGANSIVSYGAAAAIGIAALIAAMAIVGVAVGGFASGGRVGGGKQLSWLNENGSEFVINANSPSENDLFFKYANEGGYIGDLLLARGIANTASNYSQPSTIYNTTNNSTISTDNHYGQQSAIPPEVNVFNDSGRNTRRRVTERAESKKMRQILRAV